MNGTTCPAILSFIATVSIFIVLLSGQVHAQGTDGVLVIFNFWSQDSMIDIRLEPHTTSNPNRQPWTVKDLAYASSYVEQQVPHGSYGLKVMKAGTSNTLFSTSINIIELSTHVILSQQGLIVHHNIGSSNVYNIGGHSGKITIADVYQSNGVIHVIDTVLMPM